MWVDCKFSWKFSVIKFEMLCLCEICQNLIKLWLSDESSKIIFSNRRLFLGHCETVNSSCIGADKLTSSFTLATNPCERIKIQPNHGGFIYVAWCIMAFPLSCITLKGI